MTTSASHRSSRTTRRQPSGSKRRVSTIVVPSSMLSARWANPHVWNSGAAMCIRWPARSGTRSRMATAASIPASLRGAPLGVPVVPEVRITTRLCRAGGEMVGGRTAPDQPAPR